MSSRTRWPLQVVALVIALSLPSLAAAQAEIDNNFKYNSGQDIQPIFDGWSHTADGGFEMHFGYLNRNWVQELSVPVGPGNKVEPGDPDRGQPTFFYTRTNRNVFTVKVPKDFGKKEVVWTVTANGKTQKAIGWLQPEWEIDGAGRSSSGARTDQTSGAAKNEPPVVTIAPVAPIALPAKATIVAKVTDDGLPKPVTGAARRGAPAIGQETPPLLRGGITDAPTNVPLIAGGAAAGGGGGGAAAAGGGAAAGGAAAAAGGAAAGAGAAGAGAGRGGAGGGAGAGAGRGGAAAAAPPVPTVTWMVWRGPANVQWNPRTGPARDGQQQTIVTFTKPGEYVLRARANDRELTTERDVKVTVK